MLVPVKYGAWEDNPLQNATRMFRVTYYAGEHSLVRQIFKHFSNNFKASQIQIYSTYHIMQLSGIINAIITRTVTNNNLIFTAHNAEVSSVYFAFHMQL